MRSSMQTGNYPGRVSSGPMLLALLMLLCVLPTVHATQYYYYGCEAGSPATNNFTNGGNISCNSTFKFTGSQAIRLQENMSTNPYLNVSSMGLGSVKQYNVTFRILAETNLSLTAKSISGTCAETGAVGTCYSGTGEGFGQGTTSSSANYSLVNAGTVSKAPYNNVSWTNVTYQMGSNASGAYVRIWYQYNTAAFISLVNYTDTGSNVTRMIFRNNATGAFYLDDLCVYDTVLSTDCGAPYGGIANMTIIVNDTRQSVFVSGFSWNYTTNNGSDGNTKTGYCTSTSCSITNFTGTLNVTVFNISNNTYFNPYDSPKNSFIYNISSTNYTFQTFQNSLNANLTNAINGSLITSFCLNVTNSTVNQYNCTTVGNLTFYNVSGNLTLTYSNISSNAYFNTTLNIGNFNSTNANYTNSTSQGLISISAFRLFLNTTITSFNLSNGALKNTTVTNNVSFVQANNGSNNIQVAIVGNYSLNVSVIVNGFLSTTQYNVTGVYDDQFIIGGNSSGTSVSNFTSTAYNDTLGGSLYNINTTNGSILFPLLQGYYYTFTINASGYAPANITTSANTSTDRYNFTLYTQNSFQLNFYNESSNTVLNNNNITVQLISSVYANNYSTSNGTVIITLLTPSDYTIRYWLDSSVPRDYYVTLTPQSYNNLTLYIVDASISTVYLPVVYNENTRPISGAVIQLLRYYVQNNAYSVVEMATTDTNGQAVLRVVPNIINYKLLITKSNTSVTTAPTKFTASTNAYTLSSTQNALTSIATMPSVQKSLTFNNITNTYIFTWTDTNNLVTQGCMVVTRYNASGTTTASSNCSTASTGSLIYTLVNTNNTRYAASATLSTNTQFSTYTFGPVTVDFGTSATTTFGLTGFIIISFILVTVGFIANEHGPDTLILTTIIGMVLIGIIGVVAYTWEAYVGIIILGVIIVYRINR